jgi:hypothetical protein
MERFRVERARRAVGCEEAPRITQIFYTALRDCMWPTDGFYWTRQCTQWAAGSIYGFGSTEYNQTRAARRSSIIDAAGVTGVQGDHSTVAFAGWRMPPFCFSSPAAGLSFGSAVDSPGLPRFSFPRDARLDSLRTGFRKYGHVFEEPPRQIIPRQRCNYPN